MNSTKLATVEDAIRVAQALSILYPVNSIYLFGSIAEKGNGNDIDLILIVDSFQAYEFLNGISHLEDSYKIKTSVSDRFALACNTLGLRSWMLDLIAPAIPIDLFLFPKNWENDEEVIKLVKVRDETFLPTLAAQARVFVPHKQKFEK